MSKKISYVCGINMVEDMKKQILTEAESSEKMIKGNYFYIDKTLFIKEFLENRDEVTLITRPRMFGKTMNINMLEHFYDVSKDSKTFDGLKNKVLIPVKEQYF